jgi:hypothetical protein
MWINSRTFLKDVFDIFAPLHYRIGKIINSRVQFYKEWHPELERYFEGNYLIVHNSSVNWFNNHIGEIGEDGIFKYHS